LHAADTYYRRVEIITDDNPVSALAAHTADDNVQRAGSIAALRQLAANHADEVSFFSTHDVLELPQTVVKKVLVVTTSNDRFASNGQEQPTGVWLEEFAVPYMELLNAGVALTVASPKGGAMPVDPRSAAKPEQATAWRPAITAATNTRRLSEMRSDRLHRPGGSRGETRPGGSFYARNRTAKSRGAIHCGSAQGGSRRA
jgi:hypothetical protein